MGYCKFLCLYLIVPLLVACSEDEVVYDIGEYKVDLATVQMDNDRQSFLLDNYALLLNGGNVRNLEAGQRVLLNYSYLTEKQTGYDYVVKVNGVGFITQGKLLEVDSITIDTIANKPVYMESVWIGSNYLNLSFYMNYNSQRHSITLLTDKNKTGDDEISVFFRHNDNNDSPGYMHKVIVSFDLSTVLGLPTKNRKLILNINSDNYGQKDYQLTY